MFACKCHKYRGLISIYTHNQLKKSGRFKMYSAYAGTPYIMFKVQNSGAR